jgi:hypothetical protein
MYANDIELTPDKPNFPLNPVWTGQGSDMLFIISGVPEDATTVSLYFRRSGESVGNRFTADLNDDTGNWHAYVNASYTQTVGEGEYQIAFELDGRSYWAGKGIATVAAGYLAGAVPSAQDGVLDQRVRFPATGLWHRVQLIADPDMPSGFTFIVDPEGHAYVS